MSKQYCITHDMWGTVITDEMFGQPCIWTSTEPPFLPDNWIDTVSEPDAEELALMDKKALLLLADLNVLEN